MAAFLLVFFGAGIGGMLRHAVNLATERLLGTGVPLATLMVNVLGSLLMGVLAGYVLQRTGIGQQLRLFLAAGILGGFTTFSAFSLDAALLMNRDGLRVAAAYVAASVLLSIGALLLGLWLVRGSVDAY